MLSQMAANEIAVNSFTPGNTDLLSPPASWSSPTRFAFRLCFVYFGLYVLLTQMLQSMIPFVDFNEDWGVWLLPQFQAVIFWVGRRVFGISNAMVVTGSGSGDKTFDWVLNFCLLVLAIVAATGWSLLDGKRANYAKLHSWFRVFLRISLAATMFTYGMDKAVPLQMPFPYLTRLIEPYGNFSPMGVLWSFVGASAAYEMVVGCAELAGGIFLILPRTTTFGALICLMDSLQIFLLNMTYDVPVKLFSFNLILISFFLIAPDAQRLFNVFFLNRTTTPTGEAPLFNRARARQIALAAQIVFGGCLLWSNLHYALQADSMYGAARPKSPLYGIWNVEEFSLDGQPHPPLLTDTARWRRVIFDFPTMAAIESMDGSNTYYGSTIQVTDKSLALIKRGDKNWKASFTFQRPSADQLVLDGAADNHKIHAQLKLVDHSKFLLVNRGFHWVQEYPFNH